MKKTGLLFCCFLLIWSVRGEDGYQLWLRYKPVVNTRLLQQYKDRISGIQLNGTSSTLVAAKEELAKGLEGLLRQKIPFQHTSLSLIAGTPASSPAIAALALQPKLQQAGKEGFIIITTSGNLKNVIAIAANTDIGVLYGVFHFLRLLQTGQDIQKLSIISAPVIMIRMLNHWDNLNRYVERGYAGNSIWNWHTLPGYIDQRYKDYARANASVGINGTVLTNVKANALVITKDYLLKVAALADVFRPYGIKVYLTARFSDPFEIGGLKTADPFDTQVQSWWKNKADEIYSYIPDFGGFLVKANSEGQPGPQNYSRSHADGANLLADAVAPHGGIIIWRSFVYSNETPDDRCKQAYSEFKPLDGSFRENVAVQVKNGLKDLNR